MNKIVDKSWKREDYEKLSVALCAWKRGERVGNKKEVVTWSQIPEKEKKR